MTAVAGDPDAPALVLASSLGTTSAIWEPQLDALSARLRVVRYEHRGHAGAPAPPGPYELGDLGGDVLALLDRLGIERAHFCGISLGGMVGMWLAAHAPARIDRLVLCCTSARLGTPSMWTERATTVREHGTGAIAEATVERWLTPAFARERPDLVERLRTMVATTPDDAYAACCGAIERMDLMPDLPSIRAPTLVVTASQDPSTPPEHGERIAAAIPAARLERIDGAAHLVNLERPAEVSVLALEHLDRSS